MSIPHWKARPTLRPPDSRDCPYPLAGLPESPRHDWAKIDALLEELIEDDNIRPSTEEFLSSLHGQLERQGWLSDVQVQRIYDVEERRNRADGRSF